MAALVHNGDTIFSAGKILNHGLSRLARQYKLLYKPWPNQWETANFDPNTAPNRLIDFDETRTLELPHEGHDRAKFHFDQEVLANTQFATVRFLSLSFSLCTLSCV